jgi:hypothetical protein
MGANKPIEDIEATLPAATKLALDELVWGACDDGGEGHRGISKPTRLLTWISAIERTRISVRRIISQALTNCHSNRRSPPWGG